MTDLKIGIIRSSAIGDAVLASASIQFLANQRIGIEIFFFSKGAPSKLIKAFCPQVQVLDIDAIEKEGFNQENLPKLDLVIDLQRNIRSQTLSTKLKIRNNCVVSKYNKRSGQRGLMVLRSRFMGRASKAPQYVTDCVSPQYLRMLEFTELGFSRLLEKKGLDTPIEKGQFKPAFTLQDQQKNTIFFETFSSKKFLAVAPGASYLPKKAPPALFIEVLQSILKENPQLELAFLGDENDKKHAENIISYLKVQDTKTIHNLCGDLDLESSSIVLSQAIGILSNDSSLGHISEAFGKPAAVFFGPTCEGFGFLPHLQGSQAFSTDIGCRPCSKHGKVKCRYGDYRCFHEIDLSDVTETIRGWIHAS